MLIKAVLQAIPTYAMSCFRIPTSICKEMEMICAKFWWESSNRNGGLHWKAWEGLCRTKEEGGLGFRRFGYFNQSLVAKQVWRIISKPDSLMAQIFKARYFRNQDIMEAGLGSNPSFVWRSMCWGRELIRRGLGWNIVNGRKIKAGMREWFASWFVEGPSTCTVPEQLVEAYIDTEGQWIEGKIRKEYAAFEAEDILQVKICKEGGEDSRYWKYDPKGKYTVRSGYHMWLEKCRAEDERGKPSSSRTNNGWWEKIWNLKIPPKLKVFWWELSWNIIAVEDNLQRRKVLKSSACRLCGYYKATTIHALFRCPMVRKAWQGFGVSIPIKKWEDEEAVQFLSDFFYMNVVWAKEVLVAIAWGIWRKRCELTHKDGHKTMKNRAISCKEVVWAISMVEKFKEVRGKQATNEFTAAFKDIKEKMRQLRAEMIIFVDASYREGQQKGGVGVVMVNNEGEVIEMKDYVVHEVRFPLEAEMWAVNRGIEHGIKKGVKRAIIVSDCLEIVKAVKRNEVFAGRGGYILERIKSRLRSFDMGKIMHISRKDNEAAHLVAKIRESPAGPRDWASKKVKEKIRELWNSV